MYWQYAGFVVTAIIVTIIHCSYVSIVPLIISVIVTIYVDIIYIYMYIVPIVVPTTVIQRNIHSLIYI